jgi:ribosomal protein S6
MENKEKNVENINDEQSIYEIGFHLVPIVAENDLGVRVTAIRDIIETNGGKMIADEYPKQMELAYPMTKIAANKRALYHSSYFGWVKFEVEVNKAKAIEAALKADDFILRFIFVKTVRENTMAPKKALVKRSEEGSTKSEEKAEDKPQLTEEELDKTIEDLVIS